MIQTQINEEYAILITEIFDEYDIEAYKQVMDKKMRLVDTYGHFSEMEIVHGDGRKALEAGVASGVQGDREYADKAVKTFNKKVRYAYVADGHHIMKFVEIAGALLMPYKARTFDMHQRDEAMAWLIEGARQRQVELSSHAA